MSSIAHEQRVLGAIYYHGEPTLRHVKPLRSSHFKEPAHARLFEEAVRQLSQSGMVNPVAAAERVEGDVVYIAHLLEAAPALGELPRLVAALAGLQQDRTPIQRAIDLSVGAGSLRKAAKLNPNQAKDFEEIADEISADVRKLLSGEDEDD